MVLLGNKITKNLYTFFVIYLLIGSYIDLDVKGQEQIDWDDEKKVKEALKRDPVYTINQNPEKIKEFIRKNPDFVLDNTDVGDAYFNSIEKIMDSRDKELAEKFLSKNTLKNFDLSKGRLQIKDGNIVDEQGKKFILEEIKLMADVVTVESIEGGGLRFHFKKKHIVDIIEAKNIKQDKDSLIIDDIQISLPEEKQLLKINSDDKGLAVSCQTEKCNFARNGLNVNLASQGSYEETSSLIKTEKAVVTSGQNKIFGSAEFYYDSSGIDKTKPISLIGETSSAIIDQQNHRGTPGKLPMTPELTNTVIDSRYENKEFIEEIIDRSRFSLTRICIKCDVSLLEGFGQDLESGKITGYVFGLTNPLSNKRIMLNKGEVISNYDNALIIGAHKSSEFRTYIDNDKITIDGPHSQERNTYLGSVIANNGKIDHSNKDGKTVAKADRTYKFGNVPTTRFFFPEAIDENVRKLITLDNFIQADEENPSSDSGIHAVNTLLNKINPLGSDMRSIGSIKDPTLKKAYEDLAQLLEDDKKPKQVANLNDAFIKEQRVTNLYLFKKDGELKLSQSGENHEAFIEAFKVIAKEQVSDAFLSFLATKPEVLDDPLTRSQLQRLMEFMVWKNIAVHQAAAEYEEQTNGWEYIPIMKFNVLQRGKGILLPRQKADLFNKIVENDKAQQGAQAVLLLMSEGVSLEGIRQGYKQGSDTSVDLVFQDPGISARAEIERLSESLRDAQDFEQFKAEKVRILRETVSAYQKQNEPEQALIFLPELIKEKYGEEENKIVNKLLVNREELCIKLPVCSAALHTRDPKQMAQGQFGFVFSQTYDSPPDYWSRELADNVLELFDLNLKIELDENRRKFREFAESFFDAEQLTYGALLSTVSGGTGAIIGKTAQLMRAASPLGKAYYTLRGGALLVEETVAGFSSSFVGNQVLVANGKVLNHRISDKSPFEIRKGLMEFYDGVMHDNFIRPGPGLDFEAIKTIQRNNPTLQDIPVGDLWAVRYYTGNMEFTKEVNYAIRNNDPQYMQYLDNPQMSNNFESYVDSIVLGLAQLPPPQEAGKVYRSAHFSDVTFLKEKYIPSNVVIEPQFLSTTYKEGGLRELQYLNTQYTIKNCGHLSIGRSVSTISYGATLEEFLYPPNTPFKVEEFRQDKHKFYITLKEATC